MSLIEFNFAQAAVRANAVALDAQLPTALFAVSVVQLQPALTLCAMASVYFRFWCIRTHAMKLRL